MLSKNTNAIIFILAFFILFSCFADNHSDKKIENNYQILDKFLEINNDKIMIYGNFVDEKRKILKDFYFLKKTQNVQKKILLSINGKIEDSNGETIIDLSGKDYDFYGFQLKIPDSKEFRETQSFVVIPYFKNGKSVGDSFNIFWDSDTETFKLFKIPI